MAFDPKLLGIGAVALLFAFGGGSKKKTKTTSGEKTPDESEQGDLGEPVGPKGCKPGLIEKDGICVEDTKGSGTKGGTSGKLSPSDLIIDCKSFKFGDTTGDSWWKNKGNKIANQWIKSGYTDPLYIAWEMLKTTGNCFKEYPVRDDFENWYDYQLARYEWINVNRPIWELLYSVRNRIDTVYFNGIETVTAEVKNNKFDITYGKGFSNVDLWDMLKPTAALVLSLENENPGVSLGLKDKDDSGRVMNATIYLFTILFPNFTVKEILTLFAKKMIYNTELYDFLWDRIADELDGESLDIDDEIFKNY